MHRSDLTRRIFSTVVGVAALMIPALPAAAADPADLSITKTDTPDPVLAGTNITYTITVSNAGPDPAVTTTLSDATPANTTFVSLSTPAGWTCVTPAVGGTGPITCTNPSVPMGAADVFTLVVNVNAASAGGTVISNTASVASTTPDPVPANNTATQTTTVATGADVSVTKTDSPDPATAGGNVTYAIVVTNAGPSDASTLALSDTLPLGTTFVALTSPVGWTCTTPAVGGTGSVSCTNATLAAGASASFSLVVNVVMGTVDGTVITNTATVTSTTTDGVPTNNSATTTTTVGIGAVICTITGTNKSDTLTGTAGDDVICGGNGKDTINGLGGNDIILGQNGKDVVNGGEGNDTVMGGNGKDQVTGGPGIDALRGGNGKDTLDAQDGTGGDSIVSGNGMDLCTFDVGDVEDCP
jgi:uncharacterized repeat protein (TIGR01451 family)